MPHVSKKKLPPEEIRKLKTELIRSLERSFTNMKSGAVFSEFFTRTEKIMFAKRFAIIAMLKKGVSTYAIAETLLVSPSTAERMRNSYEKGKYTHVVMHALGKKDIWNILEAILEGRGIMPSKYGKGRWRSLDKHLYKKNLRET